MSTITQKALENLYQSAFNSYFKCLDQIAFPLTNTPSTFNYASLVENLSSSIRMFALQILRKSLEEIDTKYRCRPGRVQSYYVKNTRERTIITIFGELTYKRTTYINRIDASMYCHVDSVLGLTPYIRYAPCVRAKIASLYADSNSMIKVGRIIGSEIFCPFSTDKFANDYAIPRQSVHNIIKGLGKITTSFKRKETTPSSLYIMADEKFIPEQDGDSSTPSRIMNKAVVIFENCENTYSTSNTRHRLVGKTRILSTSQNIWKDVEQALYELYDVDCIDTIEIMGDGASWIRQGVEELSHANYTTKFSLDSFHLNQALLRITNDKETRRSLHDLVYIEQDKKLFIAAVESLANKENANTERILENMKYIRNQWEAIMRRVNEVSMPCAMEGAISHDICNTFTSVPKAYSRENLPIYIQNRQHYLNGTNMIHLFLSAMDHKKDDETEVNLRDQYILSERSSSSDYKQPHFLKNFAYPLQTILHTS